MNDFNICAVRSPQNRHRPALCRHDRQCYRVGMRATIWHNPNCGTSRKALERLRAAPDIELEVVEYLNAPPTREKLAQLYNSAGMSAKDGLRRKGDRAIDLGLLDAEEATILDAMAREPVLIERPLVETEKGVRLCRPVERVEEIL